MYAAPPKLMANSVMIVRRLLRKTLRNANFRSIISGRETGFIRLKNSKSRRSYVEAKNGGLGCKSENRPLRQDHWL